MRRTSRSGWPGARSTRGIVGGAEVFDPARTRFGPALERVYASRPFLAWASVPREPGVPQEVQPVRVRLTRQQLRGALPHSAGVLAPQVPAVVQEELEQRQIILPQLPPQVEVVPRPAVEALDDAAGPHDPIGQLLYVAAPPRDNALATSLAVPPRGATASGRTSTGLAPAKPPGWSVTRLPHSGQGRQVTIQFRGERQELVPLVGLARVSYLSSGRFSTHLV